MPSSDNIRPINEEAQRSLEALSNIAPPEQVVESLQNIEALRLSAFEAMSGLVKYWASKKPVVSQKASDAISEIIDLTLMKPNE